MLTEKKTHIYKYLTTTLQYLKFVLSAGRKVLQICEYCETKNIHTHYKYIAFYIYFYKRASLEFTND